jgi:hypothetical protein
LSHQLPPKTIDRKASFPDLIAKPYQSKNKFIFRAISNSPTDSRLSKQEETDMADSNFGGLTTDHLAKATRGSHNTLPSNEQEAKSTQNVLRALSPKDRGILLNLFFDRLSIDEVCAKHRVTREQIRMLLCNARRRFQAEWNSSDPVAR